VALIRAREWVVARQAVDAISNKDMGAKALTTLALTLIQAREWVSARQTIDAIISMRIRAEILDKLTSALIQAREWVSARQTIDVITDKWKRDKARHELASALIKIKDMHHFVELLCIFWCAAKTREELLRLFVMRAHLLHSYPELGSAFLNGFGWVDRQLANM
jgi:hypothetical protein